MERSLPRPFSVDSAPTKTRFPDPRGDPAQIWVYVSGELGKPLHSMGARYLGFLGQNHLPSVFMIQISHGKNVLGTDLETCSTDPMTGYHRDGCCRSGSGDVGVHVVCAQVTADFLSFSKARGNDLSTPRPEYDFPGLKPGDSWCLCALRWKEALEAGCAPAVFLESTHISALEFVNLEDLQQHAAR